MISDTRAAFKAAWVTLLTGVSGIAHVSLVQKNIPSFTTDQFPLIRIGESSGSTSFNITSAAVDILFFEVYVAVKTDVTDDVLSGFVETITDLMNVNNQVSDTCDLCFKLSQTAPQEWEESGYKYAVLIYQVQLRRNF